MHGFHRFRDLFYDAVRMLFDKLLKLQLSYWC